MSIEVKQGHLYRSADGEYIYNVFSYVPGYDTMILDILNSNLETIASRPQYLVSEFQKQLDSGTIVEFQEGEWIGKSHDQAE